jgi:magnesium chelatase subunit D
VTHYKSYPFTAIIGQELMKLALVLNAINPYIGGVLIKGSKGTAKSTAVRALADLLPKIRTIRSCAFNCNPDDPKEACHECQHKLMDGKITENEIELRNMRVINLPINATEDRVVGTISIEKALTQGLKALEPGILAESHRNILYIDEVNLLADNVADILLDAAAMGINIIEREGISLHHPAKFILVGTMNPEEGHLRPQLLDRFGLSVNVEKITDIKQRVQIIRNIEAYHADPANFYQVAEPNQEKLRQQIIQARDLLPKVTINEQLLEKIAQICVEFETEGHRADITINLTAKTLAALEGHDQVSIENVKMAARLALPHRMRKLPFQEEYLDEQKLQKCLDQQNSSASRSSDAGEIQNNENSKNSNPNPAESSQQHSEILNSRETIFGIDSGIDAGKILSQTRLRDTMNATGNVVSHPTQSERGKYVSSKKHTEINIPKQTDIAVLPTITTAALEPMNHNAIQDGSPIQINHEHLHFKIRQGKSSFLIIFCVDASGSMGVHERMEGAKGAILSILQKNYVNRDKVCMVVFRQDHAEVVLPPTRSTDLANKLLQEIPTGGTTPLAAGLLKAYEVGMEERMKATGYIPLIILISDTKGNIAFKDPVTDIEQIGSKIAEAQIGMIIIDTEQGEMKLGLAHKLVEITGAAYYPLDQMDRRHLDAILSHEGLLDE